MLVLSRKLGQRTFIGDGICITVVDIDRGKIRLGIEARRDVPIFRQESLSLAQQSELLASVRAAMVESRELDQGEDDGR